MHSPERYRGDPLYPFFTEKDVNLKDTAVVILLVSATSAVLLTGIAQSQQTIAQTEPGAVTNPIDKIPSTPITVTGLATVAGQATVTGNATLVTNATIGDLERLLQQSYKDYLSRQGWKENPDNPPGVGKWLWGKTITYKSADGTTVTKEFRCDLMTAVDFQIAIDVQAESGKIP